jgi:hypothetical protein
MFFLDQFEIELLGFLAISVLGLAVYLFRDLENTKQREGEGDA